MSTDAQVSTELTELVSSGCAGEKAARVREYFRDDWSRLRSLIMRLEEQSWQPAGGPATAESLAASERVPDNDQMSRLAPVDPPRKSGSVDAEPVENSCTDQVGTLTELARKLEQRIRTATARRR